MYRTVFYHFREEGVLFPLDVLFERARRISNSDLSVRLALPLMTRITSASEDGREYDLPF